MASFRKESSMITDHVRDMTEDDLDGVMAIERIVFTSPWTKNMFREELAAPICCNRVALDLDDVILGYSCFALVLDEVHLRNVAVHPRWRNRGVASALIDDMIRLSLEQGCLFATLEVRDSNAEALGLYGRFGFQVAGVRPSYYSDTGEDALIMWVDLRNYRTGQAV